MSSNKCHEENKDTFVLKKMIYFYVINRTYKCKDHKISQCKTDYIHTKTCYSIRFSHKTSDIFPLILKSVGCRYAQP